MIGEGFFLMKRKEKSAQVKSNILNVALRLFMAQGYRQTTIRQIAEEGKITIGTIYHFFEDKEDIFINSSIPAPEQLMTIVEQITESAKDHVLNYSVYRALEFKAVEKYDHIAEFYLEAYNSWKMTKMIIQGNMQRNRIYFSEYNKDFTDKDYYRISMALRGMRLMYIMERVHTGLNKFKEYTPLIIETALEAFNVPKERQNDAIRRAMEIAAKYRGTVNGIKF